MSLLCDPPTVLGNPLFIWFPSSPLFTLSDDPEVPRSGILISVSDVLYTILWCCCFVHPWLSDADVLRIVDCSIRVLVYRWYLMLSQKIFKRILMSSYFFTKNFVASQIFWDVPPLPGEFAFHFRDFWCPCISASVTRIFPNLRRQGRQSRPPPSG